MQWPIIPIKNLTSLFPLIFLSKHISLYVLGRLKWILDIVWPLNQHFNLKNQRNRRTTFFMLRFLIGIICILLHRPKKLTLTNPTYFFRNLYLQQFDEFSMWRQRHNTKGNGNKVNQLNLHQFEWIPEITASKLIFGGF